MCPEDSSSARPPALRTITGTAAARDRRGAAELKEQIEVVDREWRNAERKWKRRAEMRDLYFQQGRPTPRPPSVSHPGPGALPARGPHLVDSAFRVPRWGGVEELRAVLRTSAQALRPVAQIRLPVGDGRLLAALHRDSEVMAVAQVDGVVEVTARVEAWLLGKLRREGIEVELGP